MSHQRCDYHGCSYSAGGYCEACRFEKEQRDRDLAEIQRAYEEQERERRHQETLQFQKLNTGDFYCPECRYLSLKYKARRCPKCHASIDDKFWIEVDRQRAEQELLQMAANERAATEAKLRKKQNDAIAQKAREEDRRRAPARALASALEWLLEPAGAVYFFYFLPAIWLQYLGVPGRVGTSSTLAEVAWKPVINVVFSLLSFFPLLVALFEGNRSLVGNALLYLALFAIAIPGATVLVVLGLSSRLGR